MHKPLLVTCALLSLLGCQSNNPYVASSLPIPPAPASATTATGTYPSPTFDFSSIRSWAWSKNACCSDFRAQPALESAVNDVLDQYGLRPATSISPPDALIQANVRQEQRVQQVYDYVGSNIGRYDHHRYYGMDYDMPIAREVINSYLVVNLTWWSPNGAQVLWQTEGVASITNTEDFSDAVRTAVSNAMSTFPPP